MNDTTAEKQRKRRFEPAVVAALGGATLVAIATLAIPAWRIESFVGAIGLTEIVPQTRPPLGMTARTLIAVFTGIFVAGVIFSVFPKKGNKTMGMALPKISNPLKGSSIMDRLRNFRFGNNHDDSDDVRDLADLLKIRNADAHPDAPARRPLFANEDLADPNAIADVAGSPLSRKALNRAEVEAHDVPEESVVPDSFAQEEYDALMGGVDTLPDHEQSASEPLEMAEMDEVTEYDADSFEATPVQPNTELSNLTITQLVDRLERGLSSLQKKSAGLGRPEIQGRASAAETSATGPGPRDAAKVDWSAYEDDLGDHPYDAAEQLASRPVAQPVQSAPVQDERQQMQPRSQPAAAPSEDDMDDALQAALATLQRMTANR